MPVTKRNPTNTTAINDIDLEICLFIIPSFSMSVYSLNSKKPVASSQLPAFSTRWSAFIFHSPGFHRQALITRSLHSVNGYQRSIGSMPYCHDWPVSICISIMTFSGTLIII